MIYLDYSATTPVDERVLESFVPANNSIEEFKDWCRSVGYQGDFKPYEDWWQDYLNECEDEEQFLKLIKYVDNMNLYIYNIIIKINQEVIK